MNSVSVIIPCFRQAHLLRFAVDSALAQTYSNVEAIVVNDGSDDATEEVARSYGDRIRYVYQPNGGLSAARNAGITAASGDFFLFLDSDDMLHPECVEWLVHEAKASASDVAVMGYATFVEVPDRANRGSVPDETDDPLRFLIHANFGPPHCFLLSAPLIRQIGGFERSLRSCEDWDCWIRAALAGGRFGFVPRVGAYYRNLPGSMSKNAMRMLQTRTETLLRAHGAILSRPEVLSRVGQDLAEAEHRVLRRLFAQRCPDRSLVVRLKNALAELRQRGYAAASTRRKRALDGLLGTWTDRLAVEYFRLREPRQFTYYAEGYC